MDLAAPFGGISGIGKSWRLSKTSLKDHMPLCVPSDAPEGLFGT
jgi:hypothetical protein